MSSTDRFIKELNLNIKGQQPITVVYTDDPFYSIELVKDAIPTIRPTTDKIYYWSDSTNWIDVSLRDKDLASQIAFPIELEKTSSMKKTPLSPIFASPEELKCKNPIFIVSMLSMAFKENKLDLIQQLRDFDYLVRNQINTSYRLVVIANKAFGLVSDYENLLGVINHPSPSRNEIEELYNDWFIEDIIKTVVSKGYTSDLNECIESLLAIRTYVVNTMSGLAERQIKLILTKALSDSAIRAGSMKISGFDLDNFKAFLYQKKFDELTTTDTLSLLKSVPMTKVGGLELIKRWLIERAFAYSPAARARGVSKPRGALLIGPSGSGKSLIAKAMGDLLDRPVIEFQLSNVFGGLVGQSEQQMKDALAKIDAIGSGVLLVDEIDKVFPSEGSLDSGVTMRVLGKFLTWLQETESDIFVVMTANRIENIPPELLRKGRLDEIFYIGFPNATEREAVFKIHLGERTVDLKKIVVESNGYSSSEIEYIVQEATLKAAFADQDLTDKHILSEIKNLVPMSIAFKASMDKMAEWARANARPASLEEKDKKPKASVAEIESYI